MEIAKVDLWGVRRDIDALQAATRALRTRVRVAHEQVRWCGRTLEEALSLLLRSWSRRGGQNLTNRSQVRHKSWGKWNRRSIRAYRPPGQARKSSRVEGRLIGCEGEGGERPSHERQRRGWWEWQA